MKNVMFKLMLVCAVLGAGPLAVAQDDATPQGNEAEATAIDDATVDKFVVAYQEVISLQQQYSEELQQVESNEQAQAIQQEAQKEMVNAVEGAGLTVEEYNGVIAEAERNPEFAERVKENMERNQAEPG